METQDKKEAFKEVLEYLSKRGFRESNYEITELTKWLKEKLQEDKKIKISLSGKEKIGMSACSIKINKVFKK